MILYQIRQLVTEIKMVNITAIESDDVYLDSCYCMDRPEFIPGGSMQQNQAGYIVARAVFID